MSKTSATEDILVSQNNGYRLQTTVLYVYWWHISSVNWESFIKGINIPARDLFPSFWVGKTVLRETMDDWLKVTVSCPSQASPLVKKSNLSQWFCHMIAPTGIDSAAALTFICFFKILSTFGLPLGKSGSMIKF